MLNDKMNALIDEVCSKLAEREELVHTIALTLLTGKNLFVIGEPGQAKSQAIDLFRSHITGAKQFDILMSKGTDQEQLFGRLDLASIIPGHVSRSVLEKDEGYQKMVGYLKRLLEDAAKDTDTGNFLVAAGELQKRMESYRRCLIELHSGMPEMVTANKIPESHICFLDEIFKANDGVLNSLLKALNERTYGFYDIYTGKYCNEYEQEIPEPEDLRSVGVYGVSTIIGIASEINQELIMDSSLLEIPAKK